MEDTYIILYLEADKHQHLVRFAAARTDNPESVPLCGDCIGGIDEPRACNTSCNHIDLGDFMGGFVHWVKDSRQNQEEIVLTGFDIERRKKILRNIMEYQVKSRDLKFDNYFSAQSIDLSTLLYAEHIKRRMPLPKSGDFVSSLSYVGLGSYHLSEKEHPLAKARVMLETEIFNRLIFGKHFFPDFRGYPVPEHLLQKKR
jgi:hypothetical protein